MIWLDHAATSLPRDEDALAAAAAACSSATPGRGRHGAQLDASLLVQRARAAVAELVGGRTICFGSGTTFALNTAIAGWRPHPRRIAIDPWAHNAVRRPAARSSAPVWTMPIGRDRALDLRAIEREWPDDLDLVVVTHGSNVDGSLLPVAELVEIAHRRHAAVIVDAAQTIGVLPLDVGDADAIAFSGHKGLRAIPGIGALALAANVEIEPLVTGGTGEDAVEDLPTTIPGGLEAGTPNLPGIAALGVAARHARAWPWRDRAHALRETIVAAGFTPLGGHALPVVGIAAPIPALELEDALDRGYGISTRAGLHCAPLAHRTLGTFPHGVLRISAGSTTTDAELAQLGDALADLRARLTRAPAMGER